MSSVSNLEKELKTTVENIRKISENQAGLVYRRDILVKEINEGIAKLNEMGHDVKTVQELIKLKEKCENDIREAISIANSKIEEFHNSENGEEVKENGSTINLDDLKTEDVGEDSNSLL